MRVSMPSIILSFALVPAGGFCQSVSPAPAAAGVPAVGSGEYYISRDVEVVNPASQIYLNFFEQMEDVDKLPFSTAARTSMNLTDEELRSLLTITADLAMQSRVFAKILRPLVFESRMQVAESDTVSPGLREKINDVKNRWSQTILGRIQRLRALLGESRFKDLDDFVHSGEDLFDRSVPLVNGKPSTSPPKKNRL